MDWNPELDSFIWITYPEPNSRNDAERAAACRSFWDSVAPQARVSLLIEILARYRSCRKRPNPRNLNEAYYRRESFALNELITVGYRMRLRPTEQQSLTILRTAYHTCAHGSDVRPPVDLALRHFQQRAYTRQLFDALRCYRETLAQSPPIRAQELKGQIDLILWQDLIEPWKSCWTRRIRARVLEMSPARRELWGDLFQRFRFTHRTSLSEKHRELLYLSLRQLAIDQFSGEVCRWIGPPVSQVLTGTGWHVLKNLIWCGILADKPELDIAFTSLVDIPWKNRYVARKLARSLLCLWEQRDEKRRLPQIARICQACPEAIQHRVGLASLTR